MPQQYGALVVPMSLASLRSPRGNLAPAREAAHNLAMNSQTAPRGGRPRLPPHVRRGEILDAAEALLQAHGGLPLPLEQLAKAAQVSKALIYAYFPSQHDLANALLARRFEAMLSGGLMDAAAKPDPADAAQACARLYFNEVAQAGPVAHIILREPFMEGHVDPGLLATRDRIARRLARAVRRGLQMPPKEAVATLSLLTTIPEEAGRMTHAGDLTLERGRELTARLIGSSLRALAADAP